MKHTIKYIKNIRYPGFTRSPEFNGRTCVACGADSVTYEYLDVINDSLASQWGINERLKKAYSIRESMHCSSCRCSSRLRALAKAVTLLFDKDSTSLQASITKGVFDGMKIAEINACGDLHQILTKVPNLSYSEYAPKDGSIPHQDLQSLSYEDDFFDVVLTSDTLEHVPNYQLALKEINRVLKPGGYHIFTVPLIFSRPTRRRIELQGDKVKQILEPSYHGSGEDDNLVSTEFGIDFLDELAETNFQTEIFFGNPFSKNEVNYVLTSRKVKHGK